MADTRCEKLKQDANDLVNFINTMPALSDKEFRLSLIHFYKKNTECKVSEASKEIVSNLMNRLNNFYKETRDFVGAITEIDDYYDIVLKLIDRLTPDTAERLERFAILAQEIERFEVPRALIDLSIIFKVKIETLNPIAESPLEKDAGPYSESINKIKRKYLNNLNEFIEQLLNDKIEMNKAKQLAKQLEANLEQQLRELCSDPNLNADSKSLNERCRYILSLQGIEDATQLYKRFYLEPKLERKVPLEHKDFEYIPFELNQDADPFVKTSLHDSDFRKLSAKYQKSDDLQKQVIKHKKDCFSQKPLETIKQEINKTFTDYSLTCEPILNQSRDKLLSKAIKTFFGVIFTGVIFYPLLHNKIWGVRSEALTTQANQKFFKLIPPKPKSTFTPIQALQPRM